MTMNVNPGSALTYLQSFLDSHTTSYQKTMDQLSSGTKFTSVGDDPVDVCETAKLTVEINANSQASANVDLGKDMLSMAEGTQEDIISNLERIRDLCVQASNGTYSSNDKDAILEEIRARLSYVDGAANSTNFNGINIADGSNSSLSLQIGTNSNATMNIGNALIDVHTTALGINIDSSVTGATWTNDDMNNYVKQIDTATNKLLDTCAQIGGYMNRLDTVSDTLNNMKNNLTSNKSIISDTDTAAASADLVKYQILQQASVSILAQANQVPTWALALLNKSS